MGALSARSIGYLFDLGRGCVRVRFAASAFRWRGLDVSLPFGWGGFDVHDLS